jgi:hypothetical protein
MRKLLPVLFCVMLLVVSCSLTKTPAELAIKTAEEALKVVRTEAAQLVPDQLAAIEATLSGAKQSFEKGDYQAALAAAKDLPAKIKDLADAVEAKKAALPQDWKDLTAELPKLISSAKASIAKAKGVDKAVLEDAKKGVAEMNTAWTEAQAVFKEGKLMEAVTKAKEIKAKAIKILESVGVGYATASK